LWNPTLAAKSRRGDTRGPEDTPVGHPACVGGLRIVADSLKELKQKCSSLGR
jgi:hypothetical protein